MRSKRVERNLALLLSSKHTLFQFIVSFPAKRSPSSNGEDQRQTTRMLCSLLSFHHTLAANRFSLLDFEPLSVLREQQYPSKEEI